LGSKEKARVDVVALLADEVAASAAEVVKVIAVDGTEDERGPIEEEAKEGVVVGVKEGAATEKLGAEAAREAVEVAVALVATVLVPVPVPLVSVVVAVDEEEAAVGAEVGANGEGVAVPKVKLKTGVEEARVVVPEEAEEPAMVSEVRPLVPSEKAREEVVEEAGRGVLLGVGGAGEEVGAEVEVDASFDTEAAVAEVALLTGAGEEEEVYVEVEVEVEAGAVEVLGVGEVLEVGVSAGGKMELPNAKPREGVALLNENGIEEEVLVLEVVAVVEALAGVVAEEGAEVVVVAAAEKEEKEKTREEEDVCVRA
jgi:hypothetical protein